MSKIYYRIEPQPQPGLMALKIDARTGERTGGVVALNRTFSDKKIAEEWCAFLNEADRRNYRVIRCQK